MTNKLIDYSFQITPFVVRRMSANHTGYFPALMHLAGSGRGGLASPHMISATAPHVCDRAYEPVWGIVSAPLIRWLYCVGY